MHSGKVIQYSVLLPDGRVQTVSYSGSKFSSTGIMVRTETSKIHFFPNPLFTGRDYLFFIKKFLTFNFVLKEIGQ